jgi:hypothetical protein
MTATALRTAIKQMQSIREKNSYDVPSHQYCMLSILEDSQFFVRCVASCMWSNKLLTLMLLHKDEMYKPHVARLVLVHVLRIKDQ